MYYIFRRISFWMLKRSIAKHGVSAPILVSESGVVIEGNRRLKACQELGIKIPAIIIKEEVVLIDSNTLKLSCDIDEVRATNQVVSDG